MKRIYRLLISVRVAYNPSLAAPRLDAPRSSEKGYRSVHCWHPSWLSEPHMNLIILVCQLASCPPDLDQAILGIPDGYSEKLQEGTWIRAFLASQMAFRTTHEFDHFYM